MPKPPNSKNFLVDGGHYDQLNAQLRADVPYWLQIAHTYGDPILELGCGTGRVALELARAGLQVTGIDVSRSFLDRAKEKAAASGLPDTAWVCADMRDFRLDSMFRLVIIPFRTAGVLLSADDLASCFSCVRGHMPKGGILGLEAHNPAAHEGVPDERVLRYPDPTGIGEVRLRLRSSIDRDSRIQRTQITYEFAGEGIRYEDELLQRRHKVEEVVWALEQAGFEVIETRGGYDQERYTAESPFVLMNGRAI